MLLDEKRVSKLVLAFQKDDAPTKRHFFELRTRGEKPYENDDHDEGKSLYFLFCYEFLLTGEYVEF